MRRIALTSLFSLLLLTTLTGCGAGSASDAVVYEDDDWIIANLAYEEREGIPTLTGVVRSKDGASTECFNAMATLYDENGDYIAEVAGMSDEVPPNGEGEISFLLIGDEIFSEQETAGISSCEITLAMPQEESIAILEAETDRLEAEAARLEAELAGY